MQPFLGRPAWQPGRTALATDAIVVAAILLGFTAAWLLVGPVGNIPLNDDWAYAYAARSIVEHGRFALTGFTAPNLIVQAYWGALFCVPFGFSFEALRASTFVLALLGLFAAYALLREVGASRTMAAIGAITLAANPLYFQWSQSFMTDVPFVALTTVSLWLYVRGTRRHQTGAIVAAFAVAMLAMFIRQFGLLLPVSFGIALLFRRGLRPGPIATAVLPVLVFVAAHVVFQHWVVSTGRSPKFAEALGGLAHFNLAKRMPFLRTRSVSMIPYFGLFSLPFFLPLLAARPDLGRWRPALFWPLSALLGAAIFALLAWSTDLLPALGNAIIPFGLGPLTLRDLSILHRNRPLVPGADAFWIGLTAASAWLTAVLVLLGASWAARVAAGLLRWRLDPAQWIAALMLSLMVGDVVAIMAALLLDDIFDRYFLLFVVPLCVFLFVSMPPRGRASGAALLLTATPLVVCALLSIAATHDYLAWNRTRWKATDLLEQRGVPPTTMDGGYEYGGMRMFDLNYKSQEGKSWWYVHDTEYMITAGPLPGYRVEQTFHFAHWLFPVRYSVYILKRL